MTTFAAEVSAYKRRDNTYLIKVRMTHNRQTIRKPLSIYATADQLNRDRSRIKDPDLAAAVNNAINRLRSAAAVIEYADYLSVRDLWQRITDRLRDEKGFSLDFFIFADEVASKKEKGTADGYKFALNAFESFLGKRECDINAIDKTMVTEFREWIEKRNGKGCRAASAYLEKMRHIHNLARERFNDDDTGLVRIPRQPFKGMIPPQPTSHHRTLTLRQMQAIASYQPTTQRTAIAKDTFLLSFALVGINTADLYALKKTDIKAGVLTYNRAKTDSRRADKATMSIRVESEAKTIIDRHKGTKGLLNFADRYADAAAYNKIVNIALKDIGTAIGVPQLTTYHARHTWATLARNECGIPFDVVSEALNHARHGADKVTDIYVERDFSRIWEANRKVLDLVFGKNL